jgi:hypothetical protein
MFAIILAASTWFTVEAIKKHGPGHLFPLGTPEAEDYTEAARIICMAAFDLELPEGWKVRVDENAPYVSILEKKLSKKHGPGCTSVVLGDCIRPLKEIAIHRRRHVVSQADELDTLIHELVHCLFPGMEHDSTGGAWRFEQEVNRAKRELWRKAGI